MTPKQVKDILDKLPPKRRKVLVGFLAGHSREKIMIDADIPSDAALTGHLKELYKNFRIDTGWNDADDRRSGSRKLPLLISLFARCMPELISDRIPEVLENREQQGVIAKPPQESGESDAGSIEERIFKATDQLNPERPVFSRISGIQALGEIAKDSPRYHWQIMEVLAAFVRTNAPRKEEEEGYEERSPNISPDIQAALTVIGRRDWNRPIQALDLSNTDLRGANLHRANLQGVNLDGANLQEVRLIAANLERATLKRANLEGVIMHKANLQRANLEEAKLQGADLDMTDLQEADLFSTYLQRTRLRAANLQRARLPGANLQGAFLSDVNWQGAALPGVNLRGADLRRAKNLDSGELEETYGDRKAASSLPENVKAPEYWVQSN